MRYGVLMKLQQNRQGFTIIEGLIIIAVVGLVIAAGLFVRGKMNNKDTMQIGEQKVVANEPDLVIYNFGLASLYAVDITTQATRDFTKSGHKGFYVFGDPLPGTPVRHNPNYEFASVKEGIKLVSAIDGIVGFIKEQADTNDAEVMLMPQDNSNWVISYDHVTNLQVKKGDRVKVGDELGTPAVQGNGLRRFEFQINKNDGSQDGVHICPSTLLASAVKDKVLGELRTMQDKWESLSDLELYDTTKQSPIGCLQTEMTPAYAEGR